MKTEQKIKFYSIVTTGLFVIAAIAGLYFYGLSNKLEERNDAIDMEMDSLYTIKAILETQIDDLQLTYNDLMSENGELKGTIDISTQKLAEKELQLRDLKKRYAKSLGALKQDITDLQKIKMDLDAEILALRSDNDALHLENEHLNKQVLVIKKENHELSSKLEELIVINESLQNQQHLSNAAGLMNASAFRVEVEKRKEKLTVKGKRARELNISFDLIDVPVEKQGVQKIYLAITDGKGSPVHSQNAIALKIGNRDRPEELVAQQVKEVNLSKSQRVVFSYPLEDKLTKDLYKASIYSKDGWIGTVSFRLN